MVAANLSHAQPGWKFWVLWMLANIGGVIAYMLLLAPVLVLLTQMFDSRQLSVWLGMFLGRLGAAAFGFIIGVAQWWVLRKYMTQMGWWIVATLIGYSLLLIFLPDLIGGALLSQSEEVSRVVGAITFALTGAGLGVLQWLVLRGRVQQAVWWIAISFGGWVLAYMLTGLAYVTGLYMEPMDLLFAFVIPIAVAGVGLVWLLRRTALAVAG